MQKLIKYTAFYGLLLLGTSLLFLSCSQEDNSGTQPESKYVMPDSLFKTLTTDTVIKCPLMSSLTLTGQIVFNDDRVSKIYPMVSGTIGGIRVMLGDYVSQGETLGVIRSSEMAGYSNDLVNARTNLAVAKKNLDATKDMVTSGLASQKDLVAAKASYEQAVSELNRVNSVLSLNGGNTEGDYIIKSPISGFVVEKFVNNDMTIRSDDNNNLFTIADLSNVWVMANVYESNISDVHLGDSVSITTLSYPGRIFRGRIDKILNVLDPTNKVMKVRIVLANPGYLLKPQMFASVTIDEKENQQALCVPSRALIFDNSQYYVLVYKSRSDIEIKPVRIINTIGNKTFLSAGVSVGDIIISSQALLIYQALNA